MIFSELRCFFGETWNWQREYKFWGKSLNWEARTPQNSGRADVRPCFGRVTVVGEKNSRKKIKRYSVRQRRRKSKGNNQGSLANRGRFRLQLGHQFCYSGPLKFSVPLMLAMRLTNKVEVGGLVYFSPSPRLAFRPL